MNGRKDGEGGFPEWLEPLRPDEMTRQRLRRAILAEAETLLAKRRRGGWFEVASGWATLLAPTAAGVALLFAALAYRAGAATEAERLAEAREAGPEPVAASAGAYVPALLTTSDSTSDADLVLTATVYAVDALPEER